MYTGMHTVVRAGKGFFIYFSGVRASWSVLQWSTKSACMLVYLGHTTECMPVYLGLVLQWSVLLHLLQQSFLIFGR